MLDGKGVTGLTYWWQGARAGCVDFTNPDAVDWWNSRLDALRADIGVDSFKFDAGETVWLPDSISLGDGGDGGDGGVETWPNVFTTTYAETVSDSFGPQIETRVGMRTQRLRTFLRMLDKDSSWGSDNGLATLVPSLMQIGFSGYPFVLPDMIGGNGYGGAPSRELYVRWAQANVFMPAMQFSYVPWGYDDQG